MRTIHFGVFLSLTAVSLLAANVAAAEFQAGAATSNITPMIGGKVVGGFVPAPSRNIHDELHVRCLVLDDGATKLAIVVCDLLGIHRSISDEARKLIEKRLDIPAANVLICATHTHSASSVLGSNRYGVDQQLDEYQQFVANRIADGVQRAANNLRPAEIAFTTADAPEHVFNRRWYMKAGTMPLNPFDELDQVKMNPPAGSDNLIEPAGPTDPAISILSLREKAEGEAPGRPIAVYASYSLHYVGGVRSGDVSADYYGMFCDRLEQLTQSERQDPPFVALLSNGTSGDINNINFRQPRPRKQPYEQMRYVADDVAAKVHAALQGLKYRDDVTLDARYRELPVAARHPSPERLAWAKELIAKKPEIQGRDLPRIYAERTLAMAEQPDKIALPLQVLRIGDVAIGTMPCEVFCEIGLEFKDRSPLKPAFLVSLSHGYFGYLPTPRQRKLGGYETWLGTNRLEAEASDKMLADLLEMAGELKAAKKAPRRNSPTP